MKTKYLRDVCAETGASRRAVQGYEKAGLVSSIGKNKYGYLLYDEVGLERIRTIRLFQKTGLSIKEIREIIDAPARCQKEVLQSQIVKLRVKSEEISELIEKIEQYIAQL